MVHTDGLGYRGAIGAAAILYSDGTRKAELKYQLGSAKHHTVLEGELTGFILGLYLVRTTLNKHEPSSTTKPQSNSYITKDHHRHSTSSMKSNKTPHHYMKNESVYKDARLKRTRNRQSLLHRAPATWIPKVTRQLISWPKKQRNTDPAISKCLLNSCTINSPPVC
jgi:hypothetical protein